MAKKNRNKTGGTKAGREIVAALLELKDALQSGEPLEKRFSVRVVEVVDPGQYDAAAIRATRERLNVSQAVFARIVGVSKVLVQSWEGGKRVPNALARRVLDEVNRQPKHWAGFFKTVSPGKRRAA